MEMSMLGAVDAGLLIQYGFVLLMLVAMEGILSADNALVMAVMVRPLAPSLRPKALFYGLIGAVVLRFGALFFISFLANVWQAQALGAAYLIYMGVKNLREYNKNMKEGKHSSKMMSATILLTRKIFGKLLLRLNFPISLLR